MYIEKARIRSRLYGLLIQYNNTYIFANFVTGTNLASCNALILALSVIR